MSTGTFKSRNAEPVPGAANLWQRLAAAPSRLLDRYQPSEAVVMAITAIVVGLGAGLGAIVFRWLIGLVERFSFTWLPAAFGYLPDGLQWLRRYGHVVLAPALGGLLVGWVVYRYAREAKGHGVPEVMEAVALRGGRIRPIVAVVKSLASALSIGSGGSVGREGPIVQIGSALGSTLGQMLHLSEDRIRNLVACGAAAGIAATFNAPIAGVFFALEVILGEFGVASFGPVVLASVVSSVVGRIAFGDVPAFIVPAYSIQSLWEYGFYALLGVLGALVGAAYTRLIYWSEDRFEAWKGVPEWVKPAIGGALLGLLAILYGQLPGLGFERIPQVFGVGYPTIDAGLTGKLAIGVMAALMVLKLVSTALTLGSGGSGGVFAPSLFIGSMLGGAWGLAVGQLFPGVAAPAGAYALVGMGAVFAASTHAPIAGIIILFEMTGDYRIILPLMLTVVVSTVLGRALLRGESIYTLKLSRRGVRLSSGRDVDIMQGVLVEEAMTRAVDMVPADMTLKELGAEFDRTQHHGFPVVNSAGRLHGVVTVQDLQEALESGVPLDSPVQEIATTNVAVAYPDEPMAHALQRLSVRGVGRLPVVSREDPTQLVGLVRRDNIVQAYNVALTRRAEVQHRTAHLRLRKLDRTEFLELEVQPDSPCAGCRLQELGDRLPHEAVLVSIQRASGQVLIPHGDTVLQPGDRVTAFVEIDAAAELRDQLLGE
ncbi:MAG TPA: chloride channel protein [Anaerolineae bacterium]|nr:chloride channel protein [Anaerolineae bacterium]